jgi:hypothetical protein
MKKSRKPTDYEAKLRQAIRQNPAAMQPRASPQIRIAHFEGCPFFEGRPCTCDPAVTLADSKPNRRGRKNLGRSE